MKKTNPDGTSRWTPKQSKVAALVASGVSVRKAAESVGVGVRTAYDWLAKPEYKAHIGALRSRMIDAAVGRFARDATRAHATLRKLMSDESPQVRLRAAELMLTIGTKFREHAELEERIAELEATATQGDRE